MHGYIFCIVLRFFFTLRVFCNTIFFCLKAGLEVVSENASRDNRLTVSVSDSSPAHGESQDEVLRRRHGDKEVNFLQL